MLFRVLINYVDFMTGLCYETLQTTFFLEITFNLGLVSSTTFLLSEFVFYGPGTSPFSFLQIIYKKHLL